MITKEQVEKIDSVLDAARAEIAPIVTALNAGLGRGAPEDCYALKAWGDLMLASIAIEKAKALLY